MRSKTMGTKVTAKPIGAVAQKQTTDGDKYRSIIEARRKLLDKYIASEEKRKQRGYDDDGDDNDWVRFRDTDRAVDAIERHESFLPFVEAGLLPASIAIRMAVEGKSALGEIEDA
jgi:hypothetical protein